MAKTAAQKAARRQKRRARSVAKPSKRGSRRPAIVVERIANRPGGGKRKKRNRRRKVHGPSLGKPGISAYARMRGRGMTMGTDGLNKSAVVHNGSTIEDTFALRREKVCNVTGTTSGVLSIIAANQYYLNPGNTVLFPIFSQIAATYEQYRVNTLVFSYETEAYTAVGNNVSAGKVILATNYDPDDANFTSDTQMENYANSDRGAPYCEIIHDVLGGDHALKEEPLKSYYVNSSANLIAPTSNSTQGKFYDLGNFQLATQSNAGAVEIGELYVTYSFTMIRPKQQTPLGQSVIAAHYTGTATTANALTAATMVAGSNIIPTFGALTFTMPILGRFFCTYLAKAGTSYTVGTGATYGTGSTDVNTLVARNSTDFAAGNGTTAWSFSFLVDITIAGAIITLPSPTVVGSTVWDLLIFQVPGGMNAKPPTLTRVERLERMLAALSERLGFSCDADEDCESPYEECKEVVGLTRVPTINLPPTPPQRGWFGPRKDLTRQGIEPNPGPPKPTISGNCYSRAQSSCGVVETATGQNGCGSGAVVVQCPKPDTTRPPPPK